MKFLDYVFEYDRVVVGSSLPALLYAYCNNLTIVFTKQRTPNHFEFINPDVDLSKFHIFNDIMTLDMLDGEQKQFGIPQLDLWKHLMCFLSLGGNVPMSDKAVALRLEGKNTLKAITDGSRFGRFQFNELIVFDDNIEGIENDLIQSAKDRYKVIDWMEIKSGKNQKIDYFQTEDDLVSEIFLYPTDRVDGFNPKNKDVAVISHLTKEQLADFEYSDTYAKFKALKMFKDAGFRGKSNGYSKENPKLMKYYAFKLETTKREVLRVYRDIYQDSDAIKFNHQSVEELLKIKLVANNPLDSLCKAVFT